MKKVVLTGGGTAGHVTPNIALMPELKKRGYTISYIGSYEGMEKDMITETGTPYYGIATGKFRRYFDLKNFTDPFRVIKGYFEAKSHLKKIKPDVIFSKGGFVAVPVVRAASALNIPVIIHESDMTPGLANKICIPCAAKVCCNFPETVQYLPKEKAVLSGSPIRSELFEGNKARGLAFCGFHDKKPVLLIVGGSLGAVAVNNAIRAILPELLKEYQVIHLCGKGKTDASLNGTPGYVQYEFIKDELRDLMAAADVVISRAGANAICELLALRKPNILIPLPAGSSRGDQILNAESFKKQGFSYLLPEEDITSEKLLAIINEVYHNRASYEKAMASSNQNQAIDIIVELIEELSK
ncbi:MAG: undecaprenyldiphospho-muramoylpentapeptide beta-N-acetylglucosaminyltransferase [Coprococcus sp.]